MNENLNRRVQPRTELNGYTADIVQGGSAYTATVYDASLQGVQLRDLPYNFFAVKNEKFTIIISNLFDSAHYKLTARSQWMNKNLGSVVAGFHIAEAPEIWCKLIDKKTL